jgi:hypothetical protein
MIMSPSPGATLAGNAVPNFVASRDGLGFVNDWPAQPDLVVNLPVAGAVKIGDASNGLCGGMVSTVRDFYEAKIPTPAGPQPAAGTPLYRYIVRRLFDSFDLPGGVVKYYGWMNTPDADQSLLGLTALTRHGLGWHTINEEWPQIRDDIDAGHPCPLGLVTVRSINPRDLGRCHQVLAYAYDVEWPTLTIRLYDPNTDPSAADNCSLSLDISHPAQKTSITHNVGIPDPIRGFFRTRYDAADPTQLVPPAPTN